MWMLLKEGVGYFNMKLLYCSNNYRIKNLFTALTTKCIYDISLLDKGFCTKNKGNEIKNNNYQTEKILTRIQLRVQNLLLVKNIALITVFQTTLKFHKTTSERQTNWIQKGKTMHVLYICIYIDRQTTQLLYVCPNNVSSKCWHT